VNNNATNNESHVDQWNHREVEDDDAEGREGVGNVIAVL